MPEELTEIWDNAPKFPDVKEDRIDVDSFVQGKWKVPDAVPFCHIVADPSIFYQSIELLMICLKARTKKATRRRRRVQ